MDREWLFLILGIVAAIIYDIAKPWVISYYKDRYLSARERKIQAISSEFNFVLAYAQSIDFYTRNVLHIIIIGLLRLTILVIVIGSYILVISIYSPSSIISTYLDILFIIIIGFLGTNLVRILQKEVSRIHGTYYLPGYAEKIIKQLRKLDAKKEMARIESIAKTFDQG